MIDFDFQIFHKYNRLARRGVCKPLTCQHCGGDLILGIGDNDKPVLKCYPCNVLTIPGLDLYTRCRAVVMEHHL